MATVAPSAARDTSAGCCYGYSVCCFRRKKGSEETLNTVVVEDEEVENTEAAYQGDLGPLSPGHVITVLGEVLPSCERFSVNLLCLAEKGERDIALHLNPRVSQRYIVRNTRLRGSWGTEETAAPTPFPLRRGKPFTIDIFIADESFFIQINSIHFCQFAFRTSLKRVNGVEVRGEGVHVGEVRQGSAASYPSGRAPPPIVSTQPGPPISWEQPACAVLEGGLQRGQQLVVQGRVKLLPHSFSINLQSSVQLWPHPDIALHINPRFMAATKHIVIWNAWQNGSWGNEERTETSLLAPGADLQLKISCEEQHYSVWVGDNLIGIFHFRLPPEGVRAVLIQGDLLLSSLLLQKTPRINTTVVSTPTEDF